MSIAERKARKVAGGCSRARSQIHSPIDFRLIRQGDVVTRPRVDGDARLLPQHLHARKDKSTSILRSSSLYGF